MKKTVLVFITILLTVSSVFAGLWGFLGATIEANNGLKFKTIDFQLSAFNDGEPVSLQTDVVLRYSFVNDNECTLLLGESLKDSIAITDAMNCVPVFGASIEVSLADLKVSPSLFRLSAAVETEPVFESTSFGDFFGSGKIEYRYGFDENSDKTGLIFDTKVGYDYLTASEHLASITGAESNSPLTLGLNLLYHTELRSIDQHLKFSNRYFALDTDASYCKKSLPLSNGNFFGVRFGENGFYDISVHGMSNSFNISTGMLSVLELRYSLEHNNSVSGIYYWGGLGTTQKYETKKTAKETVLLTSEAHFENRKLKVSKFDLNFGGIVDLTKGTLYYSGKYIKNADNSELENGLYGKVQYNLSAAPFVLVTGIIGDVHKVGGEFKANAGAYVLPKIGFANGFISVGSQYNLINKAGADRLVFTTENQIWK